MITIRNSIFTLALILGLGACDQQNPAVATDLPRTAYEANVNSKVFGDYTIHINGFTADQLPAQAAQAANISRSKNRALLNVSIRKQQGEQNISVAASINILAKNLNNQLKNIDIKEIVESDEEVTYYIAELSVNNEETIIFDIDVTPINETKPILISYRKQFFTQ